MMDKPITLERLQLMHHIASKAYEDLKNGKVDPEDIGDIAMLFAYDVIRLCNQLINIKGAD